MAEKYRDAEVAAAELAEIVQEPLCKLTRLALGGVGRVKIDVGVKEKGVVSVSMKAEVK